MNFVLSYLKSPKLIAILLGVAVSFGAIWYGVNLMEEKGALEERLSQSQSQLDQTRSTLEQEREQFQRTISNYDDVMSSYLNQLADNQQSSQRLRQTISRLSAENDRLGQCFEEQVPEELIDQLWRRSE